MAALAVVGLAACTNENESILPESGGTQSIAVSFEGLSPATKATEGTHANDGDKKVKVKDVTILFATNSGAIVRAENVTSDDDEWNDLMSATGVVYHEMSPSVTKVAVVGNTTSKAVASVAVAGKTLAEVETAVVNMGEDFNYVTVYGKDEQLDEGTSDDEGHTNVKVAKIEKLAPVLSRIEISNIQCEDLGHYDHLVTKYIGLQDFATTTTVGGTAGSIVIGFDQLIEPKTGSESDQEGKYVFGVSNAYPAWDAIKNGTIDDINDKINPMVGEVGSQTTGVWAYQFVPGNNMKIRLYLDAYTTATEKDTWNSVVTGSLGNLTSGKIYTVNYKFKAENIGPWNPDDMLCIQVQVTVADWETEVLTPTFE